MLTISSMFFSVPLFLQEILNYSIIKTSFVMLYLTCALCVASLLSGRFVDCYGSIVFLQISFIITIISLLLMLSWENIFSINIYVTLILLGVGFGVHSTSSISGAMQFIENNDKGIATGIFFTVSTLGASSGSMIAGSFIHLLSAPKSSFLWVLIHQLQQNNYTASDFIVVYKAECIFLIILMCISTLHIGNILPLWALLEG